MNRNYCLIIFCLFSLNSFSQNSKDLFKFFSEFYYNVPESKSFVEQVRSINNNPNLGKALVEDDESLNAKILDHSYLSIRDNSDAVLIAYGEYFYKDETGKSVFQIELRREPDLNNANTFLALMKSFPTTTKVQYSGKRKIYFIICSICSKTHKVIKSNFGQVDVSVREGDDYQKYENASGQTYLVRLIVDFDHYAAHNQYDIK